MLFSIFYFIYAFYNNMCYLKNLKQQQYYGSFLVFPLFTLQVSFTFISQDSVTHVASQSLQFNEGIIWTFLELLVDYISSLTDSLILQNDAVMLICNQFQNGNQRNRNHRSQLRTGFLFKTTRAICWNKLSSNYYFFSPASFLKTSASSNQDNFLMR